MEGWLHETGGVWRFFAGEMRRECRSDALLRSHDKDRIGRWKDYKLTRSFFSSFDVDGVTCITLQLHVCEV